MNGKRETVVFVAVELRGGPDVLLLDEAATNICPHHHGLGLTFVGPITRDVVSQDPSPISANPH